MTPLDPASLAFLVAESRSVPMHVGGLQLFTKPPGAGRTYGRDLYQHLRDTRELSPRFLQHPTRSLATAGQWVWGRDEEFDLDHHVRHSALPKPGRVRELLDLVSRLHGTRLAYERPLWECHVIEGLRDGRLGVYTKVHHSLMDGVGAMRLISSTMSSDPLARGMQAPWAARPRPPRSRQGTDQEQREAREVSQITADALRSALAMGAEAAGLPGALVRSLARGARHEGSPVSLRAPATLLNRPITGARRFAAQDWDIERMRAVGRASGATINDVLLAMCGGALRTYLIEAGGLPEASLIAMVPVSIDGAQLPAGVMGGNAVGEVMVPLATDTDDPAVRLVRIHSTMTDAKAVLREMTPLQILAMTAVGLSPVLLSPLLQISGIGRPPFNVVVSNVPGPATPQYFDGARMVGMYPLSIPFHGLGLNITCTSYDGQMGFGLTGCRRTVPHLQRLLTHLDAELRALERAAGL